MGIILPNREHPRPKPIRTHRQPKNIFTPIAAVATMAALAAGFSAYKRFTAVPIPAPPPAPGFFDRALDDLSYGARKLWKICVRIGTFQVVKTGLTLAAGAALAAVRRPLAQAMRHLNVADWAV